MKETLGKSQNQCELEIFALKIIGNSLMLRKRGRIERKLCSVCSKPAYTARSQQKRSSTEVGRNRKFSKKLSL